MVERWLPINFHFGMTASAVQWIDFGSAEISEPFFHQTLKKLRSAEPQAKERVTSVATLLDLAASLSPARPSGLIFHVSRCGSTFLANILRIGHRVVMLSEARPFGLFFRPNLFRGSSVPEAAWDKTRRMFLDAVATIYAGTGEGERSQVIVKCHPVNLLHVKWIREAWPDVPSVVVIRDPVEVILSNLSRPAGWLSGKHDVAAAAEVFGWRECAVKKMSLEEYCARCIGRFLESAREVIDATCKVIDYRSIEPSSVQKIADLFRINIPAPESQSYQQPVRAYSKDPGRGWQPESDRGGNPSEVTSTVQRAARVWAQKHYEWLKAAEAW